MPDIIELLPDNIANQIAAGEVIQRPASAVKELLENAVDADATHIQLIVADAGKSLVQVIDNGKGMSETDARLSFERHATSKIKNIDDLFHIRTMGFRGEALASIAAVAQVELKTKRGEDKLGVLLHIENSVVTRQEPCAAPDGTNISMKNLFFNVPARRNFLKSNAAEMRHIIEEFIRVAMAFPKIFFSLVQNGQEVFHLDPGSHKQRIIQLLGNHYSSKLVTVKEETDYMNIYGFAGKPDSAKKTRGDQYLFVNNRFIKSPYLNHAVMSAYQDMISKDSFPLYVLYIDLDPSIVDINVHPTKQEIKFEDEKIMYAFVQAAIKHALAQFSISPSLDFSLNADIQQLDAVNKPFNIEKQQQAASSGIYQDFTKKNQAHFIPPDNNLKNWKDFYIPATSPQTPQQILPLQQEGKKILTEIPFIQLHQAYILAVRENGFILVNQQLAHERILYEKFTSFSKEKKAAIQQSLFPQTIHLTPDDALLLETLLPDLQELGYQIEQFGKHAYLIQGTPADIPVNNDKNILEILLDQFKHAQASVELNAREKLIRSLARQHAVKTGDTLTQKEMLVLIQSLFECDTPGFTPSGTPVFLEFRKDYIDKMFEKKS
ncbi:MAG: DNA mismatch repair endonuclease MutL [Bacteroidetes bacterium]|nr:DNA mismatch repair endonuclease MutL [Bacteroidota bacterium]